VGVFTPSDFDTYRRAWQQKGSLTAMLNWYRALLRQPFQLPANPRLEMPVLLMWGGRDFALGLELAEESIKLCPNGRLKVFPQANHWVQHEEALEVTRLLLDFLKV
jgi:pimeloyl-ACP methyl ester carboxylesterase